MCSSLDVPPSRVSTEHACPGTKRNSPSRCNRLIPMHRRFNMITGGCCMPLWQASSGLVVD